MLFRGVVVTHVVVLPVTLGIVVKLHQVRHVPRKLSLSTNTILTDSTYTYKTVSCDKTLLLAIKVGMSHWARKTNFKLFVGILFSFLC